MQWRRTFRKEDSSSIPQRSFCGIFRRNDPPVGDFPENPRIGQKKLARMGAP